MKLRKVVMYGIMLNMVRNFNFKRDLWFHDNSRFARSVGEIVEHFNRGAVREESREHIKWSAISFSFYLISLLNAVPVNKLKFIVVEEEGQQIM